MNWNRLYEELLSQDSALSVIGLGYVGLPIAVSFAEKVKVIGFDSNDEKVQLLLSGIDPTLEIGDEAVRTTKAVFTSDEVELRKSRFHIVAVPTPVKGNNVPDLSYLESASEIVGRNLVKGAVVVFESTVYPGVTEDVCLPILENVSKLKAGIDFKVGYSPERINPGDQTHRLQTIVKVVAGMDPESTGIISAVYQLVVQAGVYEAESIKVAEAAKVIENSQRDINIAFMNELAIIFNLLNIDTQAVLRAARTKWNFMPFSPGLVGGHCIGVDPYYLTYKAEQLGYHSQVILSGRKINDEMGKYIATQLVKAMIKAEIPIKGSRVGVLGLTFKENCPDIRNTKVIDMILELADYGIEVVISDPWAKAAEAKREYDVYLEPESALRELDAVVVAVAHDQYRQLTPGKILDFYKASPAQQRVLFDIKGVLPKNTFINEGYSYWNL